MKIKSSNYIGINQKIPVSVLDMGLHKFLLNGKIDRDELQKGLSESIAGKNRLQKAVMHSVNILSKPKPIIAEIQKSFSAEKYLQLEKRERNVIILSLIAFLYPMAYQLLVSITSAFKEQPLVNAKLIKQNMSSIYGNNRALELGIYALLPMFIELEIIQRHKKGIYEKNPSYTIIDPVIKEIYLYVDIYLSESKTVKKDEIENRPWLFYNQVHLDDEFQTNLFQYQDGYLTIEK
ncbi:MAG: hypothetical protein H7A23_08325 [Leptospiraceae bacterium]|nr:hypothetical protein [Leptospiraceae bacterium]MCP5494551.1 hypothetical protein [Leptospiraceae bacterium]